MGGMIRGMLFDYNKLFISKKISLINMGIPLNFYIDVSGQPTQTILVGLSSINVHKMSGFLKNLKRYHPKFFRSKQKGSRLKPNKIKSLISYFNGQNIHMICVIMKSSHWKTLKMFLKNKQYWKEMIYSVLYFYALKELSKKDKSYQVTVCQESYLDIEKVKNYVRKLGKAHNYNYQISSSYASQNEMIKVADLIASAGRKFNTKELVELNNYFIINPTLDNIKFYLGKLKK